MYFWTKVRGWFLNCINRFSIKTNSFVPVNNNKSRPYNVKCSSTTKTTNDSPEEKTSTHKHETAEALVKKGGVFDEVRNSLHRDIGANR